MVISGVQIQLNKNLRRALTILKGIGYKTSCIICDQLGLAPILLTIELTEHQQSLVSLLIRNKYKTEGNLNKEVNAKIKKYIENGSIKGFRHRHGLPVRGQRTHSNGRTQKGRKFRYINNIKKKETNSKFNFLILGNFSWFNLENYDFTFSYNLVYFIFIVLFISFFIYQLILSINFNLFSILFDSYIDNLKIMFFKDNTSNNNQANNNGSSSSGSSSSGGDDDGDKSWWRKVRKVVKVVGGVCLVGIAVVAGYRAWTGDWPGFPSGGGSDAASGGTPTTPTTPTTPPLNISFPKTPPVASIVTTATTSIAPIAIGATATAVTSTITAVTAVTAITAVTAAVATTTAAITAITSVTAATAVITTTATTSTTTAVTASIVNTVLIVSDIPIAVSTAVTDINDLIMTVVINRDIVENFINNIVVGEITFDDDGTTGSAGASNSAPLKYPENPAKYDDTVYDNIEDYINKEYIHYGFIVDEHNEDANPLYFEGMYIGYEDFEYTNYVRTQDMAIKQYLFNFYYKGSLEQYNSVQYFINSEENDNILYENYSSIEYFFQAECLKMLRVDHFTSNKRIAWMLRDLIMQRDFFETYCDISVKYCENGNYEKKSKLEALGHYVIFKNEHVLQLIRENKLNPHKLYVHESLISPVIRTLLETGYLRSVDDAKALEQAFLLNSELCIEAQYNHNDILEQTQTLYYSLGHKDEFENFYKTNSDSIKEDYETIKSKIAAKLDLTPNLENHIRFMTAYKKYCLNNIDNINVNDTNETISDVLDNLKQEHYFKDLWKHYDSSDKLLISANHRELQVKEFLQKIFQIR